LGVGAVTVLSRFRPHVELATVRSRMNFAEPELGIKLAVLILGYFLCASLMSFYFQQSGGMPLFDGVRAMFWGNEALAAQELLKEKRMELTYTDRSSYRGQGYVDQIRMVVLPYIFGCFTLWSQQSRRRK